MARVVRSPAAKQDISDVLRFTRARWGKEQAQQYSRLIRSALKAIASNPECGTQRYTKYPHIWGYHLRQGGSNARHILFYRISSGTVEIVRFLYDSMDFERHLS